MASITPKDLLGGGRSFQVSWYPPGGKRERTKTFRKRADARAFCAEIETQLSRGSYVDPKAGRITFREFADKWQANQAHYRHTSASRTEIALRLHVYPYIGDMSLASIRRSDIQAMATHWTPGGVAKNIQVTSVVFSAAVLDDLIPKSPVTKILTASTPDKEMVIPTLAQVWSIADAMGPHREAIILAAATGVRRAELQALSLATVDLDARTVRVRGDLGQVVWPIGSPAFLGPPKTAAAARVIPLANVGVDAIRRHLAKRPAKSDGYGGLLFPTTLRRGGLAGPEMISHPLRVVMRAHGFPEGIGLHAFRHFYASALIATGESVKVVQKRLGHTSAVETLDTYGHLWPESEGASRAAIDAAFAPVVKSVVKSHVTDDVSTREIDDGEA